LTRRERIHDAIAGVCVVLSIVAAMCLPL